MTIDERLDRIEHITAGVDEQRRREHEEDRQLWRDTQRQINELTVRVNELVANDARLGQRIEQIAGELSAHIEAVDARLGARIETLVSAIGKWIASQG